MTDGAKPPPGFISGENEMRVEFHNDYPYYPDLLRWNCNATNAHH